MSTIFNSDIIVILIPIFILISIIIGILIPLVLLTIFLKWLFKKGFTKTGFILILPFLILTVYIIYNGVYPSDDFYYEEFKRVTLRDAPESTIILRKDASFPNHFGEYCSASLMEVSTDDYFKLLKELENDKRIDSLDQIIGSEQFKIVMDSLNRKQIIHKFSRKVKEHPNYHYYIYFFDDNKTIIINLCIT